MHQAARVEAEGHVHGHLDRTFEIDGNSRNDGEDSKIKEVSGRASIRTEVAAEIERQRWQVEREQVRLSAQEEMESLHRIGQDRELEEIAEENVLEDVLAALSIAVCSAVAATRQASEEGSEVGNVAGGIQGLGSNSVEKDRGIPNVFQDLE